MGNDIIQADYDQLDAIAGRFGGQAEANQQLMAKVRQSMEPLQSGGWQGRGSAAFFGDMNREVLPAVQRMTAALNQARSVTLHVRDMMKEAEEEASRPFRGSFQGEGSSSAQGTMAAFAPDSPKPEPGAADAGPSDAGAPAPQPSPPKNAFVIGTDDLKKLKGRHNGKGQCASIAQSHFNKGGENRIGVTDEWRPGAKLSDHPHLEPGTVIATFDKPGPDGRYPGKDHGNHVAIFLGYKKENGRIVAVRVLDQWGGLGPDAQVAAERDLEFVTDAQAARRRDAPGRDEGGLLVNEANDMYVVTNPTRRPVEP